MATNYPGSLDATTNVGGGTEPEAVTALDDSTSGHPTHAGLHQNLGDAVQQIETKVGIGSSTPSANQVLGCASGSTSAWTDSPSMANVTLSADLTAVDATLSGDVTAVNARLSGDILDSLGATILDISTATLNGDITGNAATATSVSGGVETADKWTTARTLSLTGDVTGSTTIDGSANASISTTVGTVTNATNATNVSTGSTSDSSAYPALLNTAGGTQQVKYDTGLSYNASSNVLDTTRYKAATGSVGAPSYYFGTDTDSGIWQPAGGVVAITVNSGTGGMRVTTTAVVPYTDGTEELGASGQQWLQVWADNGTIQTSDERRKTMLDDALGLDFINDLNPFSGVWTDDSDGVYEQHEWLSAQNVRTVLDAYGRPQNVGMWHKQTVDPLTGDPIVDGTEGLNYGEFVPVLIKAVQELSARVEALEAG
jgi:hypothetical protein